MIVLPLSSCLHSCLSGMLVAHLILEGKVLCCLDSFGDGRAEDLHAFQQV